MIFKYRKEDLTYLAQRDPKLGRVIEAAGPLKPEVSADLFETMVTNILSQQISNAAFQNIKKRFYAEFHPFDAGKLSGASEEQMKKLGVSRQKASYIIGLARKIKEGGLDLEALRHMDDEAVVEALLPIKGIGPWSAKMLLLFGLHRPDVLIMEDLGVRNGICLLHSLNDIPRRRYQHYIKLYSPCGSLASFYLWKVANEKIRLD